MNIVPRIISPGAKSVQSTSICLFIGQCLGSYCINMEGGRRNRSPLVLGAATNRLLVGAVRARPVAR